MAKCVFTLNIFCCLSTDEEVLAVQDEITERGIKMPAFQKIGELLSGNRQEVSYESIVQQINNAISSKVVVFFFFFHSKSLQLEQLIISNI